MMWLWLPISPLALKKDLLERWVKINQMHAGPQVQDRVRLEADLERLFLT